MIDSWWDFLFRALTPVVLVAATLIGGQVRRGDDD